MRSCQVSFAEQFGDRGKEKPTFPILRRSTLTEHSNISEESNHNA
jgi:hypothetical protein